RERGEFTGRREADHRHLWAVDELLDQRDAAAPGRPGRSDRVGQPVLVFDEGEALLALPVGRLDDDRAVERGRIVSTADPPPARLRHAGLAEALALAQLVRDQDRDLR